MLPAFKLFRINKHPEYEDFSKYRTHNCNPDFIKEAIFTYQLSSYYPQPKLVRLGLVTASNIVELDGVRVHFILHCTVEKNTYSLWTFPDTPENIAWFENIFTFLIDCLYENNKNKQT
jgi:hypothetical protein